MIKFGCDPDSEDIPEITVAHLHNPYTGGYDCIIYRKYVPEISLVEAIRIADTLTEKQKRLFTEISLCVDEEFTGEIALRITQDVFAERPDDCICANYSFKVYGCLCRNRLLPG